MSFTSKVICTAVILPGKITSRVDRVMRATKESRLLIAAAERNRQLAGATDPPKPKNPRRRGPRRPAFGSAGRPFRCIGVSIYCDVLDRLDAVVERLKRAGHSKMSRSELIRIAFEKLSVDDMIAEAK